MIPDMAGKRDAAVLVAGLRMSFGGTEVLHGVDFDVRYGEVFCLLGPNGAGKTTTLEILEGFRPPTGGRVRAGDPDLIFLDEPTTGFDPEARRRCWAAIENLRGLGKTILLTTHYLDEAERLADRIAILRAGRIELCGTTHEVATRAGLATRISFTTPSALRRGQVPLPDGIDLAVRGSESVCHTGNAAMTLRLLLAWAHEHRLGDLDGLAVTAPRLEDTYLQLTRDLP